MPGAVGTDLLVARPHLQAAATKFADGGLTLAGMQAYEALRIAARRPRLELDTDHRTLPHEVGWIETAVHLNKGCYRGQETVARVHNLGHPPRRLVFLHLDGSEDRLPEHGDPVQLEDAVVGFVGSAARHYELGPIGLALIKRTTPGGTRPCRRAACRRRRRSGAAGRRRERQGDAEAPARAGPVAGTAWYLLVPE